MTEEIWKPVAGWEKLYEVSDRGRVRSLDRVCHVRNRWGTMTNRKHRGRILIPCIAGKGYEFIGLRTGGNVSNQYIHTLVLGAFVCERPDGMEACHCDGNMRNNKLSNLRWDTRRANHADKRRHGTLLFGENHPSHKLTEDQVKEIFLRTHSGEACVEIAREFACSQQHVSDIKNGRKRVMTVKGLKVAAVEG